MQCGAVLENQLPRQNNLEKTLKTTTAWKKPLKTTLRQDPVDDPAHGSDFIYTNFPRGRDLDFIYANFYGRS